MKQCRICLVDKELDSFPKNKGTLDGLLNICKLCKNIEDRDYHRSKKGLVAGIYSAQKQSSVRRKHNPPTYSKNELKEWLYSQELFHTLYDNWKRLDYQKDYVPSVDRLDDYVGYTMSNIQLMTWKENNEKGWADFNSGKNRKRTKVVYQFNLDG